MQCWAIIGQPAKRHLMAFRWRVFDDPLFMVSGSSFTSSTKTPVRVGPPLTKLWINACGRQRITIPLYSAELKCQGTGFATLIITRMAISS